MSSTKIVSSRTFSINQYRNLRNKVLRCCANIYFNHQCLKRNLTPNFTKINIPYTSPATIITKQKIQNLPFKDDIQFLHVKKGKLSNVLYKVRLKFVQEWGKAWYPIEMSRNKTINEELEIEYKIMEGKLKKLTNTQTEKVDNMTKFYPRVVNKTSIVFSYNK